MSGGLDNIWEFLGNYPFLQNMVIYPSIWRIVHNSRYPQFLQRFYIHVHRCKRGNLDRARARGAGSPRTAQTLLLALVRGLRDSATMTVEQGGGGGRKRTGNGDVETSGRMAGPSGAGERGATTKILSR